MNEQNANRQQLEGVFSRTIVNQIQNLHLASVTEEQVKEAMREAVSQALPEVVGSPQFREHFRRLADQVVQEEMKGKVYATKGDVEKIARSIWASAEPEVASALTTMRGESGRMVERVFRRASTEWKSMIIDVGSGVPEEYKIDLAKNDRMDWIVVSPGGDLSSLTLEIYRPGQSFLGFPPPPEVPLAVRPHGELIALQNGKHTFRFTYTAGSSFRGRFTYRFREP